MTEPGTADDLAGRVVVVTGASKGVGRGVALHLAGRGVRVVATARRAPALDALVGELQELGAEVLADTVDVADRDGMVALVDRAAGRWGRIDGLVANAQSFRSVTPLEEVTEHDMDVLYDTGPKGTLWSMQAVFPHLRARGWGRIVTMATALGITGAAGYGPYTASNEAIRGLTRTAAKEWGRHGILVNCVCPASAAHRVAPGDEGERAAVFAQMYRDHPLGHDGDAEHDIGPAVAFLLSSASSYVTGQTLMVDGGGVMRA
jgi:NAD(P)-dependent dehydrogenase (short-subunit alcohol dehydrogenase family)